MENNQALGSTNQVTPSVVCKYCRSTAVRKYGHYWDKQLYFCNLTICILLQFLFRCRTVGGWGWRMTKFSGATLHTGATKTYNPLKRLRGHGNARYRRWRDSRSLDNYVRHMVGAAQAWLDEVTRLYSDGRLASFTRDAQASCATAGPRET